MNERELRAQQLRIEQALADLRNRANRGVEWADISGVPTEFPPEAHTHVIADTTGLQAALDAKAPLSHTHDDRYYTEAEVDALLGAVGSAPWSTATLTFASARGAFEAEATIVDAACTALKTVELKLAATVDSDENEPEFLSPMTIIARPGAGSFVISAIAAELTAGPVKLQYRIG